MLSELLKQVCYSPCTEMRNNLALGACKLEALAIVG